MFNPARTSRQRSASLLPAAATWCVLIFACAGCSPAIAPYSPIAFEKAVDMKVDALRLMQQAEEPASGFERKIDNLKRDLDRAWEFAKGRPHNEHSARQWELMRDPKAHLLGGFLSRWETEGSLGPVFIAESQRLISLAFDAIIGLESGKLTPSDV